MDSNNGQGAISPEQSLSVRGGYGLSWILAGSVILLTVLFKLYVVCLANFDLTFDEAYYWHWSKNLDWCYFSKGPGIALMIRATTGIFGDTELGIRSGAIFCSTMTICLLYVWTRSFFRSSKTALLTVVLFSASPFLTGLGMLSTIDSPMVLLWTLASVCLWKAIETDQYRWWMMVGIAVAVGTEFKFTMLFFLVSILLAVLSSTGGLRRLRQGRWLVPVVFILFALLPILLWNVSNDWITFDHTMKKASPRGTESLLTWRHLAPSIGQQWGVMSPLIALGVLVAMVCLLRDGMRYKAGVDRLEQRKAAFLLSVASPILVFYSLLAFHRTVEANWMAPAYVTLIPAAAFYWLRPFTRTQQVGLAAAIIIGMAMQIPLVLGNSLYDAQIPAMLTRMGLPFRPTLDVTNRVRGWKELGDLAAREARRWEENTGRPVFFFADHYSLAALVGFYAKSPDRVFSIPSPTPQNQFDVWAIQGRRPPEGSVGISVYDLAKAGRLADPFFEGKTTDYSPGSFSRGGFLVRTYLFRVMENYQGNDRWLELANLVTDPSLR
ncbi:glycosyltransferase family 39 protein [bacterium]|nr:glycosyltransferase family 39 protein [bacterium]